MAKRTRIKDLLVSSDFGKQVSVMGWVRTFRNNQFIALNDGSTINNIQAVVDFNSFEESLLKRLTTGAAISINGEIVESLGKGQRIEIKVNTLEILGDSDADKFPLQPKKHSLEFLREIAHLRFRTNTFNAVFKIRHALAYAVHQFFNDKGFVYMHTPIITASDAEGAGEMFRVSTFDPDHIPRNEDGEIDNLRRGGSDYTASLIGAAIAAEEVQIWTDIDGMHNNDPRIVQGTKPIAILSFDEAAELAYFGAKILHPQSVFPAQKYKVPVRLLNTMEPKASGTLITNESERGKIKSIAAKDGITAIKIQSSRMLLAYGFLRRVFEVFERYKTPIDMITTSEVAVSVTIDDTQHLDEIIKELTSFGTVEVDYNQTIVCVVGDFGVEKHGFAARVLEAIKHIPLRMISYGGSNYNISILVKDGDKVEVLRSLHSRLFE